MAGSRVGECPQNICAVLGAEAEQSLNELPPTIRIAELRIDRLESRYVERPALLAQLVERCAARYEMLIATYHTWHSSEAILERIYEAMRVAMLAGAHVVDIATERGDEHATQLQRLAHEMGQGVIISLHQRQYPTEASQLNAWVMQLRRQPHRWVKLAVQCDTTVQAEEVMALYARYPDIIAIPMGEAGTPFRRRLCQHGAPFTYAYYGSPAAPGQLSVWDMLTQIP